MAPSPPPGSATPADVLGDPRWAGVRWTVYRGKAYDIGDFMSRHPGGEWLIALAVGRDCTALFESYHLRCELAAQTFDKLPVLAGFPVARVPRAPYPSDSPLYRAIRTRVRKEVFQGGEARGAHRRGSEGAVAAVLSFAVAAYLIYARHTGLAAGLLLGIAGGWIGVTIQHCGNHGAMSTHPAANLALGLCDDLIGGSSLMWRYHHQVSHHIHTNDTALDEDVCSMWPLLRFDTRLPRRAWHAWQHVYVWAAYPFMHAAFQAGDLGALARGATVGAAITGASAAEKASVVVGKLVHYALLLLLPALLHGPTAALAGAVGYSVSLSILLALMFFVSHNVAENKPGLPGGEATQEVLAQDPASRDWAAAQVLASANWGGSLANFFTGGLNLQIEHHLFPAVAFGHYPAIAAVVADECAKAGVRYVSHPSLAAILRHFTACLKALGAAPDAAPDAPPAAGKAGKAGKAA
ncbi:acyl-lipid (7-3)-desaturase [Scenedesmus sp. PABB004]|nr:acyl-lipid (7-3)-desaturase [Scenedesmus sp. PABB004]